jgi:hypothetical protein
MSANNGIALNSSVQHPPSDAPSFDGGRNALRSFVPYKACWDGRPCPARLPRSTGEESQLPKENAADEAFRHGLRVRSCGGFPVVVALALPDMWQDRDHEGLDPRRGLRRREDQRGRARGRFTAQRPRILGGAQPQRVIAERIAPFMPGRKTSRAGLGTVALLITRLYCIVAGGLWAGAAVPANLSS